MHILLLTIIATTKKYAPEGYNSGKRKQTYLLYIYIYIYMIDNE